MTDELDPESADASALDELAADPTIARIRSALDEAARVEPSTARPAPAPDRRRWIAAAAAAALVIGGVAALAVNMSRDHTPATGPVPTVGTLLTGQAVIIDMGEGPMMAVTLEESLPPQGGDIPLTGFDWSMVDDEQTVNGTTWTKWLQVTGTWDGTTFTVTRPPTDATPDDSPGLGAPTAGCPQERTESAASALGDLDTTTLHLSFWAPDPFGGRCGASVVAWFDTQAVRDAIDGVRADGHEVTLSFVFNPVPTDSTDPTTTTGVPSGGADAWYEIAAPGLTARPPEFTLCCPAMPAPGPDVVMAWTDDAGGIFMLQAVGHVDGSPAELRFAHYGMSDDRAKELEAKVVPGSGLPYVLDDPGMEWLAQGFDGVGYGISQRYIPTSGDGDVVLTVGDYTGQLAALAGPFPVDKTTIAGQAGFRYATNSFTVFVWRTPDKSWAQLSIAAALTSRADEIVASLTPAPLPTDTGATSTSSTAPETKPTDTILVPDTIPMPAGWMFQLIAPNDGFAVPVTSGSGLSTGWVIEDLTWNPLNADAAHPAVVTADANANRAVITRPFGLGAILDWHDRVNGSASFVVTGIMTNGGAQVTGTTDGHVLVIDVQGPGDEQWTAFAMRRPGVIGRFAMTKAIRMPNEDVWATKSPDAPMYSLSGSMTEPFVQGRAALVASDRADVGEALSFAIVGSTASWQTLDGVTHDLVVVAISDGPTPDVPTDTVLIVQAPRADGRVVQVCFALVVDG